MWTILTRYVDLVTQYRLPRVAREPHVVFARAPRNRLMVSMPHESRVCFFYTDILFAKDA
jgi:hypothetical protein